jgi:tRNA G18 (ribose-2'-O)-methylase SpoU
LDLSYNSRHPVTDPDDPRIAEFVGLRERALRRGLTPADPRQRLQDPPQDPPASPPAGGGDRLDATPDRAERTKAPSPKQSEGVFVAEGDIVVVRALQAGYRIRSVLVDATRRDPLPQDIPATAPIFAASPPVLERITGLGVHRGILASFERRPSATPAEVLDGARRVVVLERVSNPTNLGVILRSARGLGIDAVLLDPTCTDPLYRRVSRVAMGEGYKLPWAVLPRLPEGLDPVRAAGFRLVALTPDPAATPIDALDLRPDDKVALLLGAEGPGLSPETMAAADTPARIPMDSDVDSLNVGVAAGIAFWVLTRRSEGNI